MAKTILNNLRGSVPFWLCLAVSIGMEVAGFIVPPLGAIDPSVLKGVGLLFGFAALWCIYVAIDKGIDAKITHNDTTIEINNDDDKKGTE